MLKSESAASAKRTRHIFAALTALPLVAITGDRAGGGDCIEIGLGNLVVPLGCVLEITGVESFLRVIVEDGGTLQIAPGGVLTVFIAATVEEGGTFEFTGDSGQAGTLRASVLLLPVALDGEFTVTGSIGGVLDGVLASSFRLKTTGSITTLAGPLTISAPIENDGTITGAGGNVVVTADVLGGSSGTFAADGADLLFTGNVENDGRITTSGGDITFLSSSSVSAGSSGFFEVMAAGASMVFNHQNSVNITARADFNVEAGLMHFKQSMQTDGGFQQSGGTVTVDPGKSFRATGAYPQG